MKRKIITLSGVETNNKGAELMLYAILQEIERKFPNAIVYVPLGSIKQGLNYIHTSLDLREKPIARFRRWADRLHFWGIARRLHISTFCLEDIYTIKGTVFFLDASGFHFSDQWHWPDATVRRKRHLWKAHADINSKIIFLPQAFGPFKEQYSKEYFSSMAKYANLIMPREDVSYNYIKESGLVNMDKVQQFTDFTSLVDGVVPPMYDHLKNAICVIPNMRMIDKGITTFKEYVFFLTRVIKECKNYGYNIYLLNHEGKDDEELALKCREELNGEVEVVTGLNALEVKGLISTAYLVISSRFHGVVSALNSCVPCLASSWSHKYSELFKDYGVSGCILPINNINASLSLITGFLDRSKNQQVRSHLTQYLPKIQNETHKMWDLVWNT